MRAGLTLGALLSLAACTGSTEKPTGDDEPRVPALPIDSGTRQVEDGLFEPVAVGFEYIGGLGGSGEVLPFSIDGGSTLLNPLLILRFGSVEFFRTSSETGQDLNSCELVFVFRAQPSPLQIPNRNGVLLSQTYDIATPTNPDDWFTTCDGTFQADGDGYPDPENWGKDGMGLIDKFLGAHVAISFGPFTPYLEDAFATPLDDEVRPEFFAMYIAINDKAGNFILEDWTIARTFEWDPSTGVVSETDEGFLVGIDATFDNGFLPTAYVQTDAYWYQDFPLLDLDNLKDGAPEQGAE